jgi:hypothetical protein
VLFKLISLTLYGCNAEDPFTYTFSEGINFFKGKNDSGKTEFYVFLDYMFGASVNMDTKEWFHDSLESAELHFVVDEREYVVTRYIKDNNKNYFRYSDEEATESIRQDDLKEKLSSVFTNNYEALKELRKFVEEDISYRTFTVFSFLGEGRQGTLNDFFDKCSRIEYAIKMPALLNYVFNKNIARIDELKKEEERIKTLLDSLEKRAAQNDEIRARVNQQLKVLNISTVFTGENAETILHEISTLQSTLERAEKSAKNVAVTELEAIYTSLDEQIKRQAQFELDHKRFVADDERTKQLVEALKRVVDEKEEYHYLVDPIISLTSDLEKSISFNKYLIQDNSVKELKKQREGIKKQLLDKKAKYTIYSVSDKTRAVTLIKEYLNHYDSGFDGTKISKLRTELKQVREEIRILQNGNDKDKLNKLSDAITQLYKTSVGVSELSEYDFKKDGFRINYLKSGNTIQPQIIDKEAEKEDQVRNYYTGSMARHTLMQLCGYLGFLQMLIKDAKYPLIPMLVIDHISKPFDEKNVKAIGAVLEGIYKYVDKSELQIILFDDKSADRLGLTPDEFTDLLGEGKSGFNPYYYAPVTEEDEEESKESSDSVSTEKTISEEKQEE